MLNPYAEDSIVMEATTSEPTEYLQFRPNNLPGDRWLHQQDQFDPTLSEQVLRDEYALPPGKPVTVRTVEVPADVDIRIGTLGQIGSQAGGADLVELQNSGTVPPEWVDGSSSLDEFRRAD